MNDERITIGIDLGVNKDYCSAVLGIYYSDVYHLIYTTTDREQVEALNRILECENKKYMMLQAFKIINEKNVDVEFLKHVFKFNQKLEDYNNFVEEHQKLTISEFYTLQEALKVI